MLNFRTIVEHSQQDHDVTRITVLIYPLPDDEELHKAISTACLRAVEELLGCKALMPTDLN